MGYQKGDMYLLRVQPQGGKRYTFTFFLNEKGQPLPLQQRSQVTGEVWQAGYFDSDDLPQGPAMNYTLTDNQAWVVSEPELTKTYLVQNAPQKGYYIQANIFIGLKDSTLAFQMEDEVFISLKDQMESWDDFDFDCQVIKGYRINGEDVTELTYDECFEIETGIVGNEALWTKHFQELYYNHTLALWLGYTEDTIK